MTDTRFAPGPATAYVTSGVLALSRAPGIDDELMQWCSTATEWDDLADVARERHVTALVMHDADRLWLAVGGDASIVVETPDGDRRFDGTASWTLDTVDDARFVTLTATRGQGDGAIYRTDGGVVPASQVSRRLAAAAIAPTDPFELLFGHTVARSVESAAVRPSVDERERHTALAVLVFSTGQRVVVDRTIVIGRNPGPLDASAHTARPRLVKLPQAGVSRRHAAVRLDRWTATIEDLGSANGTTATSPGRTAVDLRPGHPFELAVGAVVDLGGDVSFSVEEAA